MVSQKSPRKNVVLSTSPTKKQPSILATSKTTITTNTTQSNTKISSNKLPISRPRRFSLIYSSDESPLSDVEMNGSSSIPTNNNNSTEDNHIGDDNNRNDNSNKNSNKNTNHSSTAMKGKMISNNSTGKKSKLIENSSKKISQLTYNNTKSNSTDTEYSNYATDDDDVSSEEEEEDDDDEDEDDDDSETSSDDETIDFVKLTVQRKKRAMQALNAMKRGKTPAKKNPTTAFSNMPISNTTHSTPTESNDMNSNSMKQTEHLIHPSGKNKPGITYSQSNNLSTTSDNQDDNKEEEDIGEEISDKDDKINKDSNASSFIKNQVDEMHVPKFSESEESDYDIDQDAYFDVVMDNNDTAGEIQTGLDTSDDELPILHEEEQQIVADLQNDDSLSFDGSIHENPSDSADLDSPMLDNDSYHENDHDNNNSHNDFDDDDEDEIMSDFDIPFYEDPKFSSLYYYADNSEPKLNLNTDLPLISNDKKESKHQRREAKKRELRERLRSRKLLRERVKKTANVSGDEYIFGVFFRSDSDENEDSKNNGHSGTLKNRINMDKSLKQLSSSALIDTSDDEYDNILLDIAHLPTTDEDGEGEEDDSQENLGNNPGKHSKSAHNKDGSYFSTEYSDGSMDEEDDDYGYDSSVTNIFIDIDDLDPDSFYFHYDDISSSDSNIYNYHHNEDNISETVIYPDDESTDEDDNLPSPTTRNKLTFTKPKEIVSANVVGLKPPKLGTWETDNKPFSIIDGLSTKSLHSLIQAHQQLNDSNQKHEAQGTNNVVNKEENNSAGEEMTLNELLNMSELEDEEGDNKNSYQSSLITEWYNKPKIPLSAFRNKGIDYNDTTEYMIPNLSTKKIPIGYIGVEKTRRKLDKIKELQRRRNEKKRKLKKKRKIQKLKRERARMEKEKALLGDVSSADSKNIQTLVNNSNEQTSNKIEDIHLIDSNNMVFSDSNTDSRKDSIKSVGIDEIHQILSKSDDNLLDDHNIVLDYPDVMDDHEGVIINDADADILASLTAPVDFGDFNNKSLWKQRRQSMAEAVAENMRFTKNGLFSESAIADIENIINPNNNSTNGFELNEVLQ